MDKTDTGMAKDADTRVNIADPFAKRLMVQYLDRRQDDIESLRTALASNDFDSIRVKGHNLYGSGSAYGLDRISELGAELEKAAKKRQRDLVRQLIDTLAAFIRTVHVI